MDKRTVAAQECDQVDHRINPTTGYLEPDESFLVDNYDPYIQPITEDADPEVVMRPAPAWWERLAHALVK